MAITYPIDTPATGIAQISLIARDATALTQSPFTFKQQAQRSAGQRWEADISLPPMQRDTAEPWVAFLAKLRGPYGTFLMGDPNGATARGSASTTPGTPVVNGAAQTGDTLSIDGLPALATGYLKAGDYIQIGGGSDARLYKVLDDVDTSASGEADLTLWPDLRSSPADCAAVVVANAKGLFRLSTPASNWSISTGGFYSIAFGAVEAI